MKSRHVVLIVVALAVLAFAPMLLVDSYKTHKSKQEHDRAISVISAVRQKVEAYQQVNGHYPDSLKDLSFTNSIQEQEIVSDFSNISYSRTPQGYAVGWHGTYVHIY